jgi:hypothetical protein
MRTRRTKRRYGAAPPWTAFVRVHERSGEVWRNSRYFVEVTRIPVEALDVPVIHLQIESLDHRPIHYTTGEIFSGSRLRSSERKRRRWSCIPRSPVSLTNRNAYHLWSIPGSNNFLTRLLGWGKSEDDNA